MRAASILRNLVGSRLDFLHELQFKALLVVVEAAFRASQLTLTALGRALPSAAHAKHRIKRVDRLLSNPRMHRARLAIFREVAACVVGKIARPVIAVDWTQISDDEWALWAGMPFLGRAIPLYVEVVRIRRGVKRNAHRRFLENLRRLLPVDCSPILVIDAEFCTPFFDACAASRFDFVVRLRGAAHLKPWAGPPTSARRLAKTAEHQPRCAGRYSTYDSSCQGRTLRVVVGKAIKQRRARSTDNGYQKRALQPWVLATTVDNLPASQINGLYAKRMQVEEMFRDLKNPRYGWALSHARSRQCRRLDMLALVATLAMLVAVLTGAHAEAIGVQRRFQANTVKDRRVLSLINLGRQVLAERLSLPRNLGKSAFHFVATEQLDWLLAVAKAPHLRCLSCRPKPRRGPIRVHTRKRSRR